MSALTGDGIDPLVDHLTSRLPSGPQVLPRRRASATCPRSSGSPSSCASSCWPSRATSCRTRSPLASTEWEWPRIRCDIIVERESQKGMVIGKGGSVLKQVGELASGAAPGGRLPRAARQGRQGLATPARPRRATRLLKRVERRRRAGSRSGVGRTVGAGRFGVGWRSGRRGRRRARAGDQQDREVLDRPPGHRPG